MNTRSQAALGAAEGAAAPGLLSSLKHDLPASIVVFLVALPLCLGIALASGAPLLSGLIAGIAGGLVVPLVSRSELSVSGPAAGLAAIVLAGLATAGSFEAFALAVLIAGALQMALGALRAGAVAGYFPSSVIKGMLTAIGVLLILKQLPHAVGLDSEAFGALSFGSRDENTFSLLARAAGAIQPVAALISAATLVILATWEKVPALRRLTWLPAPLAAVAFAAAANELLLRVSPAIALGREHLVALPAMDGPAGLLGALRWPDWSAAARPEVWGLAVTIAIVASLETLLNIDALDQLDPEGRKSPPNRELVAQGAGNMISGLLGGLPITSVIVRSSANVNAGARTRASAFLHGAFLLVAVLFAAPWLTRIPLACLAAILLMTGYKLARPSVLAGVYRLGYAQLVPFAVTVVAIVLTDLLKGVAVGLVVGLAFVLRESMSRVFEVIEEEARVTIRFNKAAYFFCRGKLLALLDRVPSDAHVIVDAEAARYVDHDVADALRGFLDAAPSRNIRVEVRGLEIARTPPS